MNKKLIFTLIALFTISLLHAQVADSTASTDSLLNVARDAHQKTSSNEALKNKYAKYDLSKRAIDHFMFQFGFMGWANGKGQYSLHGFSRQFNASFMLDHPFKYNPHFSLGYGLGYASDNAFMNGKYATIAAGTTSFEVTTNGGGGGNDFKKFKLVFNYVEVPLELRWSQNIENPSKGLRFALGIKGGYLLSAHSKAKDQLGPQNQSSLGSGYVQKIYSKQYFNTTRADATFRVSSGAFTLYGTYQLTDLLKSTAGPTINPYSFGIGLSLM